MEDVNNSMMSLVVYVCNRGTLAFKNNIYSVSTCTLFIYSVFVVLIRDNS